MLEHHSRTKNLLVSDSTKPLGLPQPTQRTTAPLPHMLSAFEVMGSFEWCVPPVTLRASKYSLEQAEIDLED